MQNLLPQSNQPIQVNPYSVNTNQYSNDPVRDFLPIIYKMNVKDDVRVSFDGDLNPLIQHSSQFHCRSFIATLILVSSIVIPIIIRYTDPFSWSQELAIGLFILGYILYLIVGCCCNELFQYLSNIKQGEHFEDEYNRIRGLIGSFNFACQCYHYETRFHVRYRNGHSETYTTQDKVVTHRNTQIITPKQTDDVSGKVDRIHSDKNIVFMHFKVNYRFNDDYSRNTLDQLYFRFKQNNTSDLFQNFTMDYTVPGLAQNIAFYVGDLGCNYKCWSYFFTGIGLLWPYSIWVQSKIKRFQVDFMKVLRL